MASWILRLERMSPLKFRRKPFLSLVILILIVIVFFKGIFKLTTPPKLYRVAMATLKENYVIKENVDDSAECPSRIRNYNSYVVHLHDVFVNPKNVIKQKRYTHVTLSKGFFTVPCIGESTLASSILYDSGSHFKNWASSLEVKTYAKSDEIESDIVEGYTFAVLRQETDSAYMRILDIYNTYVTVRMMRQNPRNVYILLMDTYPEDHTDKLWEIVFGEVTQLRDIENMQKFENFIWVIPPMLGPIASLDLPIPYLDEFRHHVVTSAGAVSSDKVQCGALRITVLTNGEDAADQAEDHIISNTAEIIQHLQTTFSDYEINTPTPDAAGTRQQIQTFAKTDILIGVHGNDLSNTVFLHRGSGLIELFPGRYRLISDPRFQQLADWSNVYYLSWYNMDFTFRDSQSMAVDPSTVISLVNDMKRMICSD